MTTDKPARTLKLTPGAAIRIGQDKALKPEQGAAGAEAFAIGADRYLIPRTLLDPPPK